MSAMMRVVLLTVFITLLSANGAGATVVLEGFASSRLQVCCTSTLAQDGEPVALVHES
jgi:hypothetical protein